MLFSFRSARRIMRTWRPQLESLERRLVPSNPVEGHVWTETVYGFNVHRVAQAQELKATVDWGDGERAKPAQLRQLGGAGSENWGVWDNKKYRHWGSYEVDVRLQDTVTNAFYFNQRPMQVEQAALHYASMVFEASENTPYYGPVAQIEYDNPLATKEDLVALIGGWGDDRPKTEQAEVRQIGTGVFQVWGQHTYKNVPNHVVSANYTVTAQVLYVDSIGGGSPQRGVQGNSLAIVANVAAPANCVGGINWDKFVANYRQYFGKPSTAQQTGLRQLLSAMGNDPQMNDPRWRAYVLATVKHEADNTFRPIKEYGGASKSYGQPTLGPDGRLHRYYGRGYVQLTHKSNYVKMGRVLWTNPDYADLRRDRLIRGPNDLANNPDLLYNPRISYAVTSYGMRNGSFRNYVAGHRYVRIGGKLIRRPIYAPARLGTFINARRTDYFNAREIINADKNLHKGAVRIGDLIGSYARKFETVLRNSKCNSSSAARMA